MPRIHKLDENLINLIAAGEVVERPSSVLKELLENALDAGASRIAVELEGAGKRLVAVSDDGEGMDAADAILSLERHATSKLRKAGDLAAIRTLGFRGEALPAIAAVSRLELTTAPRGGSEGTRVRLENGSSRAEATARGPGTTVVVRDLFHGTPARRKFLRSDATELRRLLDVVLESSLAHLHVAFEVRSGGRELMKLPASSTLTARLASLYGPEYADRLLPVGVRRESWELGGSLQAPHACGRGRRRQLLYVNGRPVQDRSLAQAAFLGYASTLPAGVFPHFFLFLSVPPDLVDVNVHPAKREVRFREAEALFGFVQAAVREALGGLAAARGLSRPRTLRRTSSAAWGHGDSASKSGGAQPVTAPSRVSRDGSAREDTAGEGANGGVAPARVRETSHGFDMPSADQLGLFLNARLRNRKPGEPAAPRDSHAGGLWQLHATFILAQTRTGLAVIDQHSAHERVLYEAILSAFERELPASQELVFPRTYALDPAEWHAWEENRTLFERLGFRVEPFGEGTIALRGVPVLGRAFHPEQAFQEILGDLADERRPGVSQHERLGRSVACRAAIKAGQELDVQEMSMLVNDLFGTRLPSADVHGRPAVIQISLEDLARRFDRA
jgi:DNA mismatch repair protein MutL